MANKTFIKDRYHYRSVPLALLKDLIEQGDVHFFSLQHGESAAELNIFSEFIADLDPHTVDMADTAAHIKQLDLVISVDTSVAHLAGALAIPTWTLLPYASEWRWLLTGEKSPWYPTMRLFRQRTPGDWDAVIKDVSESLRTVR
jgi:ADP-heptose:LPS heptosyltransferase